MRRRCCPHPLCMSDGANPGTPSVVAISASAIMVANRPRVAAAVVPCSAARPTDSPDLVDRLPFCSSTGLPSTTGTTRSGRPIGLHRESPGDAGVAPTPARAMLVRK